MRPGALDKVVSFERDPDEEGGAPLVVVVDEPCAIEPITAEERARGNVLTAIATHRLRLWYHPDVTPAMRAVYADPHSGRTRRFELVTVTNIGEAGVELACETVERVT